MIEGSQTAFTVLGGAGFIGRHLTSALHARGLSCLSPRRGDATVFERQLGHVIYCIGVTADFRTRTLETVEAHVCALVEFIARARFDSFLYLSSTRVYKGASSTEEESRLVVSPSDADDFYNLTKLTGEALCLADRRDTVRVARLSNVYGRGMSSSFLASVIHDAVRTRHVVLQTSFDSEKDYICVDQVADVLPRISIGGRARLYNVASGVNTTNRQVADRLMQLTGCTVEEMANAGAVRFPPTATVRIRGEFGFQGSNLCHDLAEIVAHCKEAADGGA